MDISYVLTVHRLPEKIEQLESISVRQGKHPVQ